MRCSTNCAVAAWVLVALCLPTSVSSFVILSGFKTSISMARRTILYPEWLPQSYFEGVNYERDAVPWDLFGKAQPAVRNAAQAGAFGAAGTTILDCGCGAGDNANWLAARGYNVVGFDLSPSAVAAARKRGAAEETAQAIAKAGGSVDFCVASAIHLWGAEQLQERANALGGFPVALDSALLHCLDDEAQQRYLDGLRSLVRPDGRLFIGCFSDANPDPWKNPRRISEAQMRALLCEERGWRLLELKEAWYERPAARTESRGGAWTMAWWASAEKCPVKRFPTPNTTPEEVLYAQLAALSEGDLMQTCRRLS